MNICIFSSCKQYAKLKWAQKHFMLPLIYVLIFSRILHVKNIHALKCVVSNSNIINFENRKLLPNDCSINKKFCGILGGVPNAIKCYPCTAWYLQRLCQHQTDRVPSVLLNILQAIWRSSSFYAMVILK